MPMRFRSISRLMIRQKRENSAEKSRRKRFTASIKSANFRFFSPLPNRKQTKIPLKATNLRGFRGFSLRFYISPNRHLVQFGILVSGLTAKSCSGSFLHVICILFRIVPARIALFCILRHISGGFRLYRSNVLCCFTPALNRTLDTLKRKRLFSEYSAGFNQGITMPHSTSRMLCMTFYAVYRYLYTM